MIIKINNEDKYAIELIEVKENEKPFDYDYYVYKKIIIKDCLHDHERWLFIGAYLFSAKAFSAIIIDIIKDDYDSNIENIENICNQVKDFNNVSFGNISDIKNKIIDKID